MHNKTTYLDIIRPNESFVIDENKPILGNNEEFYSPNIQKHSCPDFQNHIITSQNSRSRKVNNGSITMLNSANFSKS